mgnify:CR=1 FL=1
MKRIVWKFGDGSTQYTHVDPLLRRAGETEAQQIERLKTEVPAKGLKPAPIRLDGKVMDAQEYGAHVAALGAGARPEFVGVIDGAEYMDKFAKHRDFRAAWAWITPDPVIDSDIGRAREIHRERLRKERAPVLAALDVEYQRADEQGNAKGKADIAKRKQALRDATADPRIEAEATIDDLKSVTLPG